VQDIDDIKIELPLDFTQNFEDLDYCFIQNANTSDND
jgi:hypothetical protein